jgi:filamentous hemagglutinin family protein
MTSKQIKTPRLLAGTSVAAIILSLLSTPAHAQLAAMRAAAGTIQPPVSVQTSPSTPLRSATMRDALARQQNLQSRAQALATYVTSAKSAALASIKATPTDGISDRGLNPIQAVRAATIFVASGVDAATIRGNSAPLSVAAVNDLTGQNTWEGALAPVQSTASTGKVTVRIDQTQERALLNWQNFDVGTNTALVFNQKLGGVAQKGWTVVNRVANPVAPSTILGSITADGAVLVLNRSGVLFGPTAQVNLHSLVASSLELGSFASSTERVGSNVLFVPTTIKDRVTAYLQNGLLVQGVSGQKGQLLSSVLPDGRYDINQNLPLADIPEGDVLVYSGANITSGSGGFIILAGPTVHNAGTLSASEGQVSLQGGRFIGATPSTGASGSADENVRGLILATQLPNVPLLPQTPTPDQGVVINSGLITSRRGYISLGSGLYGEVTNDGLLSATTSVSRNGKIALTGGSVTLAGSANLNQASGITILPDDGGETIPQGSPDSPPAFKSSQIAIGNSINSYLAGDGSADTSLLPTVFSMEKNAFILAPNAKVVVGHDVAAGTFAVETGVLASVNIAEGAIIDVSGVKAVARKASDNSVRISPAKQNELRDTPNYRPVRTDGGFTLNGATLLVDARASGVRADGVAWVGSPLLEAASAVSQIPVSAAELMTKGGNISIDVGAVVGSTKLDADAVSAISIAKGAIFDVSGGWTTYSAGIVTATQLLTNDGRVVGLSRADPNDIFVDIVNGYTAAQTRLGISQTFSNAALQGQAIEDAYDEGRDAGALQISGSLIAFDGTVHANAFAGTRQLASAIAPTGKSSINGDPRKLQFSKYQLPSGGLLRIGSFSGSSGVGLGQDIVVYRGLKTGAANAAELLLDDRMISNAGLSGLMLQTSGAVTLASVGDAVLTDAAALAITGKSNVKLADGGILEIDAGRTIKFNGDVQIAGGQIAARTYQLTDVLAAGIGTLGNPFYSGDDITQDYVSASILPRPFDVTVTGTLSVAGKWVNDYLSVASPQGAGWIDGGSISLTVAPRVFVPLGGSIFSASVAGDISGSIRINDGALLDVSAGGHISNARQFNLSAQGGNVSLINETTYASVVAVRDNSDFFGSVAFGQTVAFTPEPATPSSIGVRPALVPISQNSEVKFGPGSLRGFGFTGGGTFNLISPNIAFGTPGDPAATFIPLDFLQKTGFGTLDITSYRSRTVRDLFDNASEQLSSFFETTRFVVGGGQTLDLTQVTLPDVLDTTTETRLLNLKSGENLADLLTPAIPRALWYRKSASLLLRGLTELEVEAGGSIIGAPQAAIVAPKLYNAGTIRLPGGTIQQIATLPGALNLGGIGLFDAAVGGSGFDAVFGAPDVSGRYATGALNTGGILNIDGSVKTNNQIFTTPGNEQFLYFLGRVATNDGIVLASGSTTDLAGIAVFNPNAPLRANGSRYDFGRLIGGGSITTAAPFNPANGTVQPLFPNPAYGFSSYRDPTSTSPSPPPLLAQTVARRFVARSGSLLDVSGASATFDIAVSASDYAPSLQWSDAGTVGLRAGGTLSGATINANGGSSAATGGTLEWLMPTIRGIDDGAGIGNIAFADHIASSGFDTLVAYGGLALDGTFSLKLGKSLLVRSAASLDGTAIGPNAAVTVSATGGTTASVEAPYIAFASRSGTVRNSGLATGNAAVTFSSGALGTDFFGSTLFDSSIAQTNLNSAADVRLIGVDDRADTGQVPVLNGSLVAAGNLTFDAARVYTTTGTGNLQRILEIAAGAASTQTPTPFLVSALGNSTITFLGSKINTNTPLSAGSFLQINASKVVQNGYVAAPLGRIAFGSADNPIDDITFGANSVTLVSGTGLNVPYGTTTDLSQYFFTAGSSAPLTQLPSGNLRVSAGSVNFKDGSKVVGSGGGDVFAYEFVSGTGGSRDVLSRFNTDVFSSNDFDSATGQGFQYADKRQVYALVPSEVAAKIAFTDPIYSADYGLGSPSELYGTSAGLAVTLDGGGGFAPGQYVLMPGHYALLPGAYRIVENTGAIAPASGTVQTLLDGSIVLGGVYSTAGTSLTSSQRRSFTLQSQASFLRYSSIRTTSGSVTVQRAAASSGIIAPRLPLDAARVVLDPLRSLEIAGTFDMTPAKGGRGSTVDILGSTIFINQSGTLNADGLVLSNRTIANLNANSLMIGGERIENSDGTTRLGITASRIVATSSADIAVPELIFAVAGIASRIDINDGAKIAATGTLADDRAGNYLITSDAAPAASDPFDQTGIGSVFRLSNGPQRVVSRLGSFAAANARRNSLLNVGEASLSGNSLLLNSNFRFSIADTATLSAPLIAISASNLSFGETGSINSVLESKLAGAAQLNLSSSSVITFDSNTSHTFRDLTIDAPGLALTEQKATTNTLTINAGNVRISNSQSVPDAGCTLLGITACGTQGNILNVNAQTLTLGSGTFAAYSFDGAVNLTSSAGMYVIGSGSVLANGAALKLTTPFLIDRASVVDLAASSPTPSDQITPKGNFTIPVTPDYGFVTKGAVTITAAGTSTAAPAGLRAPGARLSFGSAAAPVAAITIDGTALTATSGVINIQSRGDITLAGTASLSTPGYSRKFGDAQSTTTISAGGGTVNLVSFTGNIILPATSSLNVDSGIGNAGRLNLLAAGGAITLDAALNSAVIGARTGSFSFDAGTSAFDLDRFAARNGSKFQGDLSIRSGAGDLALGTGQGLRASSVSLTADGGSIMIGGKVDTSGVTAAGLTPGQLADARISGGDVALWGRDGVVLTPGAVIDTHTSGYAETDQRQASAGNVTIGIGNTGGAIEISAGATIDLGARWTQAALAAGNSGNRLIKVTVKDPNTLVNKDVYQFVAADTGGTLSMRAPIVGAAMDQVDVRLRGTVIGASSRQIEAYRRYNIDDLSGTYDGLSFAGGIDFIDPTPTGFNILSDVFVDSFDGTQSIPYFIQNFGVRAADGSDLAGIRLRPGVDLISSRAAFSFGNWNLAAGTLDVAGARAAGLIVDLPELGFRVDGTAYFALKPGSESRIVSDFVSFLYRVGGKASGEAGVFNIKAARDLGISGSITDGFFNFADKSDAAYINYQLGGGDRTYNLGLLTSCGTDLNCAAVTTYSAVTAGTTAANASNTLTINLSRFLTGNQQSAATVLAPYNAAANSVLALGSNTDPVTFDVGGDAVGFAQLFPRLTDGSAVHSSSLRLVAGAIESVNPLTIDRANFRDLSVLGEAGYLFSVEPGTVRTGTSIDLKLARNGIANAALPAYSFADFLSTNDATNNVGQLTDDSYTSISWGDLSTTLALDFRPAAQSFFDGRNARFLTTSRGVVTGVAAPLADMLAFLTSVTPSFVRNVSTGSAGYPFGTPVAPAPLSFGTRAAFARTLVRTGDGSIALAASGNVDLRNGVAAVYRNESGRTVSSDAGSQVGGTAVYTAGVRVSSQALSATVVGTGRNVSITPDSIYLAIASQDVGFLPSPKGFDDQAAVLADNGGSITVATGGSILGRRDEWSERFLNDGATAVRGQVSTFTPNAIGDNVQRWRPGEVGQDTEIVIAPKFFSSGLGALAGGNVALSAGGSINDLTVALDAATTTTTSTEGIGAVSLTLGRGDLAVKIGGNLGAGQIDVAHGSGRIDVDGSVVGFGLQPAALNSEPDQYLRIRLARSNVALTAQGSINLAGVSALGAARSDDSNSRYNQAGFFTPTTSFSAVAGGGLRYVNNRLEQVVPFQNASGSTSVFRGSVLPPTLRLVALTKELSAPSVPLLLYPSKTGNLELFSAGDIASLVIAMSDSEPSLLAGSFSAANLALTSINANGAGSVIATTGLGFGIPGVDIATPENLLRLYHNENSTYAGNTDAVRIFAGNDITNSLINLPKASQVTAGGDIINLFFTGQNANAQDTTVISAGRDITSTTGTSTQDNLPFIVSNNFVLGGGGSFVVQAGRDIGPFINSALVNNVSYAGGIQTVGNLYNPWFRPGGANLTVLFGIAGGVDYAALRETYLNPANAANLDKALFVLTPDNLGVTRPDRAKPLYAPVLAKWLRTNDPASFLAIFGLTDFPETTAGNAALANAAYSRNAEIYAAFAKLDPLLQNQFLLKQVLFNELAQPAQPDSPSYLQYYRGYRAVQTLFPVSAGYTDNLSIYTTDPATISADTPQGIPTRNLVNGEPQKAPVVATGNADLRLATLQTVDGGDLSILGPGGNFIAGSVVRTSTQAAQRVTRFGVVQEASLAYGQLTNSLTQRINAIPIGYEGVLTLNGGAVSGLVDGNFLVNQSRVFTQAGGDITLWSSNGDLNAGQGPRSASNFPPVTVRFNLDGFSRVDSAGSVSGAGIGAFQRSPTDPTASITLVAPVGEVDAGDAGVRATGNVLVAAARVANSDGFSAGGSISGVPAQAATAAPVTPTAAASAVASQGGSSTGNNDNANRRSIISVEVLGFAGSAVPCEEGSTDPACRQ